MELERNMAAPSERNMAAPSGQRCSSLNKYLKYTTAPCLLITTVTHPLNGGFLCLGKGSSRVCPCHWQLHPLVYPSYQYSCLTRSFSLAFPRPLHIRCPLSTSSPTRFNPVTADPRTMRQRHVDVD